MTHYICIHGHFYQPPRENAWFESILHQETAAPFPDWNERINAECYFPNTCARILNNDNQVVRIQNNYKHISFNFGPTLLSWLKLHAHKTYEKIVESDRESTRRLGHGNALAQVYNHMIMPLANSRDKETQVIWGIKDFIHHFNRSPEGMWLAETAVDLETLDLMYKHGIRFTILAPSQAASFVDERGEWISTSKRSVDTTLPYYCHLPSGNNMAIFVYDGPLSNEVAFKGLLHSGKTFADHLYNRINQNKGSAQLIHLATDGESYGHHHRLGEMALADCLQTLRKKDDIELINYATFLDRFPPKRELKIVENSSWSCAHGVERWQSDCGCNTGKGGYHQKWRAPLREALDWLREKCIVVFEKHGATYLTDPWEARNQYIQLINNRSFSNIQSFLDQHQRAEQKGKDGSQSLRLLEVQRQAMLMYTSCGWFFDEVAGIETIQILEYALRVIRYLEMIEPDIKVYEGFLVELEKIPSNEYPNGRALFIDKVLTQEVPFARMAALGALFLHLTRGNKIPLFTNFDIQFKNTWHDRTPIGDLYLRKGHIRSKITTRLDQFAILLIECNDHTYASFDLTESPQPEELISQLCQRSSGIQSSQELYQFFSDHLGLPLFTEKQLPHGLKSMILSKQHDLLALRYGKAAKRLYLDHTWTIDSFQMVPEAIQKVLAKGYLNWLIDELKVGALSLQGLSKNVALLTELLETHQLQLAIPEELLELIWNPIEDSWAEKSRKAPDIVIELIINFWQLLTVTNEENAQVRLQNILYPILLSNSESLSSLKTLRSAVHFAPSKIWS